MILETCGSISCWGGWADYWVLEGQEVSSLLGKQCLHHHQDSSAVFPLGQGEGFSLWWTRPVAARGFFPISLGHFIGSILPNSEPE